MTFGGIFSEINLEIPTLNIKLSFCMFATSKEMAKIVTKQPHTHLGNLISKKRNLHRFATTYACMLQ
jgi:hypothetical protein